MRISVCMITKNEEDNIGRALSSIPSSFEKIVIDTGSTDQTMEIARTYAAEVSSIVWEENFSQARNKSIRKASGDYILIMDADEELAGDTEQQIEHFISKHPLTAGTVTINNLTKDGINRHKMVRFFPNKPEYYFEGIVHEKLMHEKKLAEYADTGILVTHYGYQQEQYEEKHKFERYVSLYQKQLQEKPNDGYILYQLGKLYFSVEQYQKALNVLTRCFELEEEIFLYFPVMLVTFGYTLKNLNQSKRAETILLPYHEHYPDFPDLPFLIGLLGMDTGNLANIEAYFNRALQIGETNKYTSVEGVGSYKAAHNLGVFYEITGNISKATHYYNLSANDNYEPAKVRLAQILK